MRMLPPSPADVSIAVVQAPAVMGSLRTVAACFPVTLSAAATPLAASEAEKSLLAALAEQQLSGERAAVAAEAAHRRAAHPADATATQIDRR